MLKLKEVIDGLNLFISDPEKQSKSLQEIKQKISIKEYIPLYNKVLIVYRSLLENNLDVYTNPAFFVSKIEISLFFNGLLAYTDIDCEDINLYKSYENYDLFHITGMAKYLLSFCGEDYNNLKSLLKESINFANIEKLTEALSNMDTKNIKDLVTAFEDFKKNTDPKLVENIADVVRYNDPMLLSIKEDVVDNIIEKLDYLDKKVK